MNIKINGDSQKAPLTLKVKLSNDKERQMHERIT